MAGHRKEKCECDSPIDPTIPRGYDKQCRRCFELNKLALKMHERARQAMEDQERLYLTASEESLDKHTMQA